MIQLITGVRIVTSTPGLDHQTVVFELGRRLRDARPRGLRVVVAPFAVRTSEDTEIQPDVLVAKEENFAKENLPTAPLLAVEVLSRATALLDLHTKKALYERLGTPSYWVIDPINMTLTVFELDQHGSYQQVAEVAGHKPFEATQPFPVRIVPADLLEG